MNDNNFYMTAKTMFGLENVLANELKSLGAMNIKIMNRAVSFKGDKGFMYKANLNLRTALRILKPISYFQAHNEKELYEKLYNIKWEKLLDLDNTFSTQATTHSIVFTHSKYISLIIKDAIVDRFRDNTGRRPNVNPKNPDISINLHIAKHTCTVSLDSSGESLHKRGYKSQTVLAPINEVLAAGLILLSGWDKKTNFHDPMCGSGTLLIEAALIAKNIPANIFRKKFGFEGWKDFDNTLFEKIKENSLDKEKDYNGKITGCDTSNKAVQIAKENIENALMYDQISITKKNFFHNNIDANSFVIFNPPYGERISLSTDDFYDKIGTTLKHKYKGCSIWLISSDIENMKFIGLRPNKKIKLINGKLECSFRNFEIYEGSKKNKKLF